MAISQADRIAVFRAFDRVPANRRSKKLCASINGWIGSVPLARLNLLIIDELGFVPLSTTGAELLFEVFSQRYERGSILVTTNPALRRVDRGLWLGKAHRGTAGPPHPPRAHPGDERRQLPPQGQPAECCRASASVGPAGSRLAPCQGRPRPRSRRDPPPHRPGRDRQASPRWHSFAPPCLSTFSESVLTNWPAEMSYSPYGECDFESKRTGKTSGPEQFAR